MRITESRLRRIIRSVIRESNFGRIDPANFNKSFGNLMFETGSDHYDIERSYVDKADHYGMIDDACRNGYTSYGMIDEEEAAEIFREIGCACDRFEGKWFAENAQNIINCLNKYEPKDDKRKMFFAKISALLHA
jgi:hypothetical protein